MCPTYMHTHTKAYKVTNFFVNMQIFVQNFIKLWKNCAEFPQNGGFCGLSVGKKLRFIEVVFPLTLPLFGSSLHLGFDRRLTVG